MVLRVSAKVDAPYHIYDVTQPWSPDKGGALPTAIELTGTGALKPVGEWVANPPPVVKTKAGAMLRYHEGEVIWMRRIEIPSDARPGEQVITGAIGYNICTDAFCKPPSGFTFRGVVEVGNTVVDEPAAVAAGSGRGGRPG
jgi:hypothetical protein